MIEFIGRLHPLLVHLPIGFLILLATLELLALSPRRRELTAASGVIVTLIMPAAIVSATCGWLLSWSGGYDEVLLTRHKWLGVSVAVASVVMFFVRRSGSLRFYRLVLLLSVVLVGVTGHFGGMLTYGEDYFTAPLRKILGGQRAAPAEPKETTKVDAPVYAAAIQPLFNDYCVSCHGEKKSKGKLRLDSYANLDKGGESGATVVAGSAALSLMGKRLRLPEEDEDHMPPAGKKQPTKEEMALLNWWMDAGASDTKTVAELNPPAEILKTVQSRAAAGHQ